MQERTVEQVTSWPTQSFTGGHDGLHDLAGAGFTGAIDAGPWLFMLNGRLIGVFEGELDDVEEASGTAYTSPDPSLPLLFTMLERGGEQRAQYYSGNQPLGEADRTLEEGGFTGYVELSENVLSGDYYVVYYGGQSMACAFIGNAERLKTGDEAFDLAADVVGNYTGNAVDVDVIDVPGDGPASAGAGPAPGAGAGTSGGETEPDGTDTAGGAGAAGAGAAGSGAAGAGAAGAAGAAGGPGVGGEGESPGDGGGAAPGGSTGEEPAGGASAGADDPLDLAGAIDEATGGGSARSEPETEWENSIPAEEPDGAEGDRPADDTDVADPSGTSSAASGPAASSPDASGPDATGTAEPVDGSTDSERSEESDDERTVDNASVAREIINGDGHDASDPADAPSGDVEPSSSDDGPSPDADPSGNLTPAVHRRGEAERVAAEEDAEGASAADGAADEGEGEGAQNAESTTESAEIERLKARAATLEQEHERLRTELESVRVERDDAVEERNRLEAELDRVRERLETLEGGDGAAGASGGTATRSMSVDEALDGTNLFVRYETKSDATLEDAHGGGLNREALAANLDLECHTTFDHRDVTVDGMAYEPFLHGTLEHRFVTWLVEDLIYEIRDTDHDGSLKALYDALPEIDRAELHGSVSVSGDGGGGGSGGSGGGDDAEQAGEDRSFDVVCRDRLGNPLVVANLLDSRTPAEATELDDLLSSARAVGQANETMTGAFVVTTSFFEPEALEAADAAADEGGLLSGTKRASYVKLGRKVGFHLCLVEGREQRFHVVVPEL